MEGDDGFYVFQLLHGAHLSSDSRGFSTSQPRMVQKWGEKGFWDWIPYVKASFSIKTPISTVINRKIGEDSHCSRPALDPSPRGGLVQVPSTPRPSSQLIGWTSRSFGVEGVIKVV